MDGQEPEAGQADVDTCRGSAVFSAPPGVRGFVAFRAGSGGARAWTAVNAVRASPGERGAVGLAMDGADCTCGSAEGNTILSPLSASTSPAACADPHREQRRRRRCFRRILADLGGFLLAPSLFPEKNWGVQLNPEPPCPKLGPPLALTAVEGFLGNCDLGIKIESYCEDALC
ncbi:hypothetical protein GUJ93_ZPchr0009g1526 [Zizania palustris]|uniref:Uncharacterized protein n=1 Tax=Zizania palustris TaxID=103762 RepID=A0A8J5V2W2_ZIZPA|nr:hypothetical protein GUJ93_ZPchr0009g1526 [Zizania palustris]